MGLLRDCITGCGTDGTLHSTAGGERLSAGQMSEPKSLLVDTRLSGVHYFDVLAVMS